MCLTSWFQHTQYAELHIGMDLQGRKSNKLPCRDVYSIDVNLLLKFNCTRKGNLCGSTKQNVTREKFGYVMRGERPVYHHFLHQGRRVSLQHFVQMYVGMYLMFLA